MTDRKPYDEFRSRRKIDSIKFSRELRAKISRIFEKILSKIPNNEWKTESLFETDAEGLQENYSEYRALELNFYNDVYGKSYDSILGFDPNWDRSIRNEAKQSGDDVFLKIHAGFQAQIEDSAEDFWHDFINTESTDALIEYLRNGGQINHIVRSAIIESINPQSKPSAFFRYETFLAVKKILEDNDYKISKNAACNLLAEERFTSANQIESNARKYRRHVKEFEDKTGFKLKCT